MRDGNLALRRNQRACERGVDVADRDDLVDGIAVEPLLEPGHHRSRLRRVRTGSHLEIRIRLGDAEVGEQRVGHRKVVVLAGVNEHRVDTDGIQAPQQWRNLHEVRPGTGDDRCPHRVAHHSVSTIRMNAEFEKR